METWVLRHISFEIWKNGYLLLRRSKKTIVLVAVPDRYDRFCQLPNFHIYYDDIITVLLSVPGNTVPVCTVDTKSNKVRYQVPRSDRIKNTADSIGPLDWTLDDGRSIDSQRWHKNYHVVLVHSCLHCSLGFHFSLSLSLVSIMSPVNTVLQILIFYYLAQIAFVNYRTWKLHNVPPPPPPKSETIIITKTVDVEQTRDHLTQQQLLQIHKEVEDKPLDIPDLATTEQKWTKLINENLKKIQDLAEEQNRILSDHPLPEMHRKTPDNEREASPAVNLSDLSSFISISSFKDFSAEQLKSSVSNIIEQLEDLESYNLDLASLNKSRAPTCKEFLTRKLDEPVKKNYATREEFELFVQETRREISEAMNDPLSSEKKAFVLDNVIGKSRDESKIMASKVSEMFEDLNEFVEDLERGRARALEQDELEEVQTNCVEEAEVQNFLDEGMAALVEQRSIYEILSNLVDGVDESIVLEASLESESDDKSEEAKKTLRDTMLSLPIYPKVIEAIDASVEFVAGYSDVVDQIIDAIGGVEEGGVGKNLESKLNELASRVQVPLEFEAWKRKLGMMKEI